METVKKVARAAWIAPIVYVLASGYLKEFTVLADLLVFFVALAGLIAGIVCLALMAKYGAKGIVGPAIAAVLVNVVLLGIWVPNFLTSRDRARAQSASRESANVLAVHIKQDGTILVDQKPVTMDQLRAELARFAKSGGDAVQYSRDNPTAGPPPNAMEALRAIAETNLPIQMLEPDE